MVKKSYQYKCLNENILEENNYHIEPLRQEDMLKIKEYRNKQMDVLRQKQPLTDEGQILYYQKVVIPLFKEEEPKQLLFSYFYKQEFIGYGGLTNIDWEAKRAEVSFLVDPSRVKNNLLYEKDFQHFLAFLKRIAKTQLKFNRLFTETYDIRPFHVGILEANGFEYEGRMKEHVVIKNEFVDSLLHGCLLRSVNHA
ncbi:GNAT family N-acetyltransferase [Niallia sp. JL1B1071]|uniref:GNAT family N-acetyltransferase n=1 Tax=Niallia tiangongensis TaxID=3237105 RepID=UPI0037DC3529